MELYKRIAVARKQKGLTQEQLADLTNVTVRTIQRIESGESTPRAYTLKTIATALDINFEELKPVNNNNNDSLVISINLSNSSTEEDGKHFLQMLCLSCFSYLVIPYVHFLIPARLLKKSNEQNPKIIAFARRVIRGQLYWTSSVLFLMLLTLAYNLISAHYFQQPQLINYLWPFFFMYFINASIISASLLRITKADFS
jgi:XRE family transcriptional regulator, regulator of sulfur utilization